ncbi:MAG: hypothetical protein ACJ8J7_11790, partial [Sulfurifustaceae bacterium]
AYSPLPFIRLLLKRSAKLDRAHHDTRVSAAKQSAQLRCVRRPEDDRREGASRDDLGEQAIDDPVALQQA